MEEYPVDWFRVFVDTDAEFVAQGQTEQEAIDNVVGYCNDNRFLELDPEMMFPYSLWAKPLSPIEADYYKKISDRTGFNGSRLVTDKRSLKKDIIETHQVIDENQFRLFAIIKTSIVGNELQYSYYNE